MPLTASISLRASLAQNTPDENDPPAGNPATPAPSEPGQTIDDGDVPVPTTSDSTTPGDLICVTPDYQLGLKLNQGVGLSLRIFGNRVWIEGVDHSSGYAHLSTISSESQDPDPNPTPAGPPPNPEITPDDRK